MLVVLSEESFRDRNSINGRELYAITETARMFGCRICPLPLKDYVSGEAETALSYLPSFEPPVPGVWVGYIPTVEWYSAIYQAAKGKGVKLVNSPAQHQTAMEFDLAYPLIKDLTPESLVLRSVEECSTIGVQLGFPVFVKGAIKSNKEQGWRACVARDESELTAIARALLEREGRSRGKVVVRQLVNLRRVAQDPNGFPISREYRVFVYQYTVLAYGFYWEAFTDSAFSSADEQAIVRLAVRASQRLKVPLAAIDVAQLDDGEWIVIEVNDAQFSGLSQVPILELWSKIKDIRL